MSFISGPSQGGEAPRGDEPSGLSGVPLSSSIASAFTDATQLCAVVTCGENSTRFQPYGNTSPCGPWHSKLLQRLPCTDPFRIGYRPRTIPARFSQLSCGGGSSCLGAAPPPEPRQLRVRPQDVGVAPVGLFEEAQLIQPPVPRGILCRRSAHSPAWMRESTDTWGTHSRWSTQHDRGKRRFRAWRTGRVVGAARLTCAGVQSPWHVAGIGGDAERDQGRGQDSRGSSVRHPRAAPAPWKRSSGCPAGLGQARRREECRPAAAWRKLRRRPELQGVPGGQRARFLRE
jgi:hypothetical protein